MLHPFFISRWYDADVIYKLIRRKLTNLTGHVSSRGSDPINILNQLTAQIAAPSPLPHICVCTSLRGTFRRSTYQYFRGGKCTPALKLWVIYLIFTIWFFCLIFMLSAIDFSNEWCFEFRYETTFTLKIWTKFKSFFCMMAVSYITGCNNTSKQVKQEEI